jgi:hypothetical protein
MFELLAKGEREHFACSVLWKGEREHIARISRHVAGLVLWSH